MQARWSHVVVALAFVAICGAARADVITVSMDEVPAQAFGVAGLALPEGVTFYYTHPTNDEAQFGATRSDFSLLDSPVLEMSVSGTLEVVFATPATFVGLAAGRLGTNGVQTYATVALFDANDQSLGSSNAVLQGPPLSPSEGLFEYDGAAAVKRMAITFPLLPLNPSGYVDTLRFEPVPEPTTAALLGFGEEAGLSRSRRRSHR